MGLRKQCKESLVVVVVSVFMLSLLSSVLMLMLPPEFVVGAVSNRKLGDANCSALNGGTCPTEEVSSYVRLGTDGHMWIPKESYSPSEATNASFSYFDHLILLSNYLTACIISIA